MVINGHNMLKWSNDLKGFCEAYKVMRGWK